MVTMAAYGAMIATMSAGARIAADRETGWTRQLRISPLPIPTYFRTKVVLAYLTAGDDDRAAVPVGLRDRRAHPGRAAGSR